MALHAGLQTRWLTLLSFLFIVACEALWGAPASTLSGTVKDRRNEYDDDQNQLPLGGYFVLSATVSRPLPKGFTIFVSGDNLTNQSYEIARTPVVNLGQPIIGRISHRWQSAK